MALDAAFDVVDDLSRPRLRLPAGAHSLEKPPEPVEVVANHDPDGVVGGFPRPQVRRLAAGDARHRVKGRHPKLLVELHHELGQLAKSTKS